MSVPLFKIISDWRILIMTLVIWNFFGIYFKSVERLLFSTSLIAGLIAVTFARVLGSKYASLPGIYSVDTYVLIILV